MNSGESALGSSKYPLSDQKMFGQHMLAFLPKRQKIRVLKSASNGKIVMWGYEGYELRC